MRYTFAFSSMIVVCFWANCSVAQIKIDSVYGAVKIEDRYPSFFPDGKKIIFQSNRVNNNIEIFSSTPEGLEMRQLTNNKVDDVTPVVSPDGKQIAFCSCATGPCDIMLMNADGTGLVNITNHPSDDSHPKFTRDGKSIIFCSDRDKPGTTPRNSVAEIYIMNLDGKELKRLTNNGIWNTYPSYSPSSDQIVYRRIIHDSVDSRKLNSEIFIMAANGTNIVNLSNHPGYEAYPEFSPDGRWILFSSNRNGMPGNYKIYVMDHRGQNVQQVSFNNNDESDQRATWSPDGRKIIFNRSDAYGNVRILIAEIQPVSSPQIFNLVESVLSDSKGCSRGLAWGDYDNDGKADVVVANCNNQNLRLYKNIGNGKFEMVTNGALAEFADYAEGVAWIDYDNDFDLDLFVTAHNDGPNFMFRNDSLRRFTKVHLGALTSDRLNSNSSCWCDFDNDGDVDVFIANKNAPGVLYENINGENFNRVSETRFPTLTGDGRTCAWGDIDGDGFFDLFIGNFTETVEGKPRNAKNYLLKNAGGKRFEQITTGHVVNQRARTYGSSFADVDNDGDADLMVTNIGRYDTSFLYVNIGRGDFQKKYISAGKPSKGHAWGDYNLDGFLDLIIAAGTENVGEELVNDELFYGLPKGNFEKVLHGDLVNDGKISAGVANSDYDNDGDLDLLIANWGNSYQENRLYRNDVYNSHWIKFKLRGNVSNSFGVGAKVTIKYRDQGGIERTQTRWLLPQTGYASQNDYSIHFGLGSSALINTVEIKWSSGKVQIFNNVKTDCELTLDESRDTI